jgi:RNA polymerase sigma factor (sigma-70 family)
MSTRDDAGPVREPTLGDLLRRAGEREWAAWAELIRRYRRLVHHTARRMGLAHGDAADVEQLTWMRLLEHGHQIRDPACLPAWLVSTARRESLRLATAAHRVVLCADPTVDNGVEHRGAVTDVYPADDDYEPALAGALSRLPPRYERLIRMMMSDECPNYVQLARAMNVPVGSIGPMRMRALRMLRRAPELNGLHRRAARSGRPESYAA